MPGTVEVYHPPMSATEPEPHHDPIAEVEAICAASVPEGGYHAGLLSIEIRDRIRTENPQLWEEWIELRTAQDIQAILGRLRHLNRRRAAAFRRYRSIFDRLEEADASHTQLPVGQFTRPMVRFAMRSYRQRARANMLTSLRFEVIDSWLTDDTTLVQDAVPEEVMNSIFDSPDEASIRSQGPPPTPARRRRR